MHSVPGGPFSSERKPPHGVEQAHRPAVQPDLPLREQYLIELNNYAHLNFGLSFRMADFSVNDVDRGGLPVSATLGVMALGFALALEFTAGVVSAVRAAGCSIFH